MPEITFGTLDGDEVTVDVPSGLSVMEGALMSDVEGIVAECGGNAMCGTCHVYVDTASVDGLPEIGPAEAGMLDFTASARLENSRLSCQLKVDGSLDGLRVSVPESQL